jgi:hypothetical protein
MSTLYPRLRSIAGHLVTSYSDIQHWEGIRFYTFLREPLARTASHYQFMKKNRKNLETVHEWLHTGLYRNVQTQKIAGEASADKAIEILHDKYGFVGLQEHFDESLVLMKQWVADPDFDIRYESKNVASSKKISRSLLDTPEYRAALEEANQEDLKLYAYVKEEWFPKQKRRYSGDFEADLRALEESKSTHRFRESLSSKIRRRTYKTFLPFWSRGKTMDSYHS